MMTRLFRGFDPIHRLSPQSYPQFLWKRRVSLSILGVYGQFSWFGSEGCAKCGAVCGSGRLTGDTRLVLKVAVAAPLAALFDYLPPIRRRPRSRACRSGSPSGVASGSAWSGDRGPASAPGERQADRPEVLDRPPCCRRPTASCSNGRRVTTSIPSARWWLRPCPCACAVARRRRATPLPPGG